jgi:ribose-phosphate pyrophosphokinase
VTEDVILFGGTANPALAEAVARELGIPLAPCTVERFPDGELTVRLGRSVRRREVFVLQATAPPVNDHLMELLSFADACRRSAAARVIAVVPYFGYARATSARAARARHRQPRGHADGGRGDQPGAHRRHPLRADGGFFRIPMDTLSAVGLLCDALRGRLPEGTTVVSPDAGRVKTASEFAERLRLPLAVLNKHRESGTRTRVTHIVGDVRGRACLIVDDMISTGRHHRGERGGAARRGRERAHRGGRHARAADGRRPAAHGCARRGRDRAHRLHSRARARTGRGCAR